MFFGFVLFLAVRYVGSYLPDQGSNVHATTGLPGKSFPSSWILQSVLKLNITENHKGKYRESLISFFNHHIVLTFIHIEFSFL